MSQGRQQGITVLVSKEMKTKAVRAFTSRQKNSLTTLVQVFVDFMNASGCGRAISKVTENHQLWCRTCHVEFTTDGPQSCDGWADGQDTSISRLSFYSRQPCPVFLIFLFFFKKTGLPLATRQPKATDPSLDSDTVRGKVGIQVRNDGIRVLPLSAQQMQIQ